MDPKIRHRRAKVYQMLGRYEDELKDRDVIVAVEREARAFLERAQTYRTMGRYDRSMADIDEAFKLTGDHVKDWRPFYNRALTYSAQGQHEKALRGQ